jgi:predicted transcriptional regulator
MADSDRRLENIKRLLILLLMKLGSTLEEIAIALQVDPSSIRRAIRGRKVKKIVD